MTPRITIEGIRKAATHIDKVFLQSPQYECEPLSQALNVQLTLKVETLNPIRSFKGRGADHLLATMRNRPALMCASAGNFGQAMGYACRKRGVKLVVYASTVANPLKIERMRALGAEVRLHGDDFDAAKEEARRQSAVEGIPMIEDGLAVETAEGAGTMGLELLQAGSLDALLIPLGNGALFNGIATVFKALSPQTKMIAVQAAGAPAMIESFRAGKVINHEKVATIADGIAVRLPIAEALDDMKGLVDDMLTVREANILKAMRLIHEHAGIVSEPSGATGIAAILEHPKFAGMRVATIICGGNLTPEQIKSWLG